MFKIGQEGGNMTEEVPGATPEKKEPDPDKEDADEFRFPTLGERWSAGLLGEVLNPPELMSLGMGKDLDRVLGGGVQAGNMLGLVSASAGAGKSAFLNQMADEMARRGTPVVVVSELLARDYLIRSLARVSAIPGYKIRAGTPEHREKLEKTYDDELADAMDRLVVIDKRTALVGKDDDRGPRGALESLAAKVRGLKEKVGKDTALVIIDPIHRLLDYSRHETEALNEALATLLEYGHREKWVTVFASDTVKTARTDMAEAAEKAGESLEDAAEKAFRGSYQLLHLPDFAFAIHKPSNQAKAPLPYHDLEKKAEPEWHRCFVELVSPKLRYWKRGDRPGFAYDPSLFRFKAVPTP